MCLEHGLGYFKIQMCQKFEMSRMSNRFSSSQLQWPAGSSWHFNIVDGHSAQAHVPEVSQHRGQCRWPLQHHTWHRAPRKLDFLCWHWQWYTLFAPEQMLHQSVGRIALTRLFMCVALEFSNVASVRFGAKTFWHCGTL